MRRALCVGIDNYVSVGSLRGCVSDAERIADVLARNDDSSINFDCRLLLAPTGGANDVVTQATLISEIEELLKYPAEIALLHFSGHGTASDLAGFLVTQDAANYSAGVRMDDVIKLANESPATEVVILLDCCYSGQLGQIPTVNNNLTMVSEGISILTASRGDQPSVEDAGGGVFTSLVLDALEGGAADILGEVTSPAVYAFVEAALGAWDQRPLFKAHVTRATPLRRCHPKIDPKTIRNLPNIFKLPAEDLALDPSFEDTTNNFDPNNVKIMKSLQELCRVHLVVPVGENHMYDAAINSKWCRLTATGRYYWRLANSKRI